MKMIQSSITLRDLRFYAYHGVALQERQVGNYYTIQLRISTDLQSAMQSDDVEQTVNYASVFEAVKEEMSISSKLLEHVAQRIGERLFHDFPQIEHLYLKLEKDNPPMGADIQSAGIEVEWMK